MTSAGRNPRPPLPGSRSRGITAADVDRAADSLLRDGERPTIEKVRARIGRGSPNTINPLLDQWWSRLAGRLDSGPAALHRLPQSVAMAAEALWLTAVEAARERASQESRSTKARLAEDRRDLEVRSHILSIREAELTDRLDERESRIERLETELQTLLTMLRKEQASRAALERRLASEESTPRARPKAARRKAAAKKVRTGTKVAAKQSAARRRPAAKGTAVRRKSTASKRPSRQKAAAKKAPSRRGTTANQPKQARKSAGRKTFSSRRVTARTAKRTNR